MTDPSTIRRQALEEAEEIVAELWSRFRNDWPGWSSSEDGFRKHVGWLLSQGWRAPQ